MLVPIYVNVKVVASLNYKLVGTWKIQLITGVPYLRNSFLFKPKSNVMSKKFQLQIPEPCRESWDKMTPVEQGRFCDSCQKTVVDFTAMSDMQLAAFFKKPSTGSVCGRFYND